MLTVILDHSRRCLIFTLCSCDSKNLLRRICKQHWDSQTRFSINHEAGVMHVLSDTVCVTHSLSVRCVTPAPHSFTSRRQDAFSRKSHHITSALRMHFWLPTRHLTFLILLKPSTPIISFAVFHRFPACRLSQSCRFSLWVLLWDLELIV